MNAQEIYDKVVTHLLTQKRRAVDELESCMYRTESGLKCAVGCLIPDELYDPGYEGCTATSLLTRPEYMLSKTFRMVQDHDKYNKLLTLGLQDHSLLLGELQDVHDNYMMWGNNGLNRSGKAALKNLAKRHDLVRHEGLK